jgi:hypothetical protein
MTTLAHNTARSGEGTVPVIIEDAESYPFGPGERESDWHEASEAEYAASEAYWAKKED